MPDNERVVRNKVSAYLALKADIENLKGMQDNIKKELSPYLSEAETNTRGSYVIPFTEPLEMNGQRYKGLQNVRKESTVLNEERTIEFLKVKSLTMHPVEIVEEYLAPVIKVEHVDHDALWDLYARDLLSKEEYDSLFDTTVSWAFSPTKE